MKLFGIVEMVTAKSTVVRLEEEGQLQEKATRRITVSNKINAEVGSKVELSVTGNGLAKTHYAVRLLPLFFTIVGILLSLMTASEIMRFAIISASVFAGFVFTAIIVLLLNCKSKTKYNMIKVITE